MKSSKFIPIWMKLCLTHMILSRGCVSPDSWASLVGQTRTMIGPVCHSSWGVPGMIHNRHPEVAATMVRCLSGPTDMRHFTVVVSCPAELRALGCNIPEWEDLPTALPRPRWSRCVGHSKGGGCISLVLEPSTSPARRAMLRSQGGPLSGLPFTFLTQAKTWSIPKVLRARACQSWLHQWAPSCLVPLPGPSLAHCLVCGNLGADSDAVAVSDVLRDFCRVPIAD